MPSVAQSADFPARVNCLTTWISRVASFARLSSVLCAPLSMRELRRCGRAAPNASRPCLCRIPLHFAGRDAKHVPAHWRTFGTRRSPLSSAPRKAATPANGRLNYLYTVLEAETRLSALAVGCDPALGIIPADKPGRDSLACDLMEPIRPRADEFVLRMLASQTFERSDFFETRDGNCRLMPEISCPLATTAPQCARDIAPVA